MALVASLTIGPVASAGEVTGWSGNTMGTSYSVKVYTEDASKLDLDALRLEVDSELRRINDEMSTYLKSSQISQFNDSISTDWFAVSQSFAEVVAYAQRVAKETGGAFDVTVGPLVDAWSFGPGPRTDSIPTDAKIRELASIVGYEKLAVRLDPPSIKKSVPGLRIDLSAIAKGHGVDRIVEKLAELGVVSMFVEIGGEVRAVGKKGDQSWKVGVQVPDAVANQFDIAYEMTDQAMATSGDYRNYIEVDGTRYSHTIDPRTGRPITHGLASVSILSGRCMESDAWATALNVLGESEGLATAAQQGLSALLVSRGEEGFRRAGTGDFAGYSRPVDVTPEIASATNQPWAILAITFIAFAVLLFAMAVGVIFSGKKISGSCGGIAGTKSEDGSVSCSLCSNPADACKDLRERMQEKASTK